MKSKRRFHAPVWVRVLLVGVLGVPIASIVVALSAVAIVAAQATSLSPSITLANTLLVAFGAAYIGEILGLTSVGVALLFRTIFGRFTRSPVVERIGLGVGGFVGASIIAFGRVYASFDSTGSNYLFALIPGLIVGAAFALFGKAWNRVRT